MKPERFDEIMQELFRHAEKTSRTKQHEYDEDEERFSHFLLLADRENISVCKAMLNCRMKHEISLEQMINSFTGWKKPLELWREKIGDNIVYLCLIYAAVVEAQEESEKNAN